jgi:cleavage stimulation factor subunit 3
LDKHSCIGVLTFFPSRLIYAAFVDLCVLFLIMANDDSENAPVEDRISNTDTLNYDVIDEQGEEVSDSDDYDPSKTLQDQYSASSTYLKLGSPDPSSFAIPPALRSTKEALAEEADQMQERTDIYPSCTPPTTESRISALVPLPNVNIQPKTRTVGGFVIEDDDEDDKGETEYEPPAVLGDVENIGSVSASMPEDPISENANEPVSTSGVSIQPPAPDMASSKVVSNNSYSPVPVASQNDAPFVPGQKLYSLQAPQIGNTTDSPTPTLPTAIPAAPRGRLPHDRVGILEDRINEDPRGDLSAWLELISEHRNRNRIESTRDVYERFFKVFPLVVSFPLYSMR